MVKMLEKDSFLYERMDLAITRIGEIGKEQLGVSDETFPWENYFVQLSEWMKNVYVFIEKNENGDVKTWSLEAWKEFYSHVFAPIREKYETSYANPNVTEKAFGLEYGKILSVLASEIYRSFSWYMMGNYEAVVSLWELFVEMYTAFVYSAEEHHLPKVEDLEKSFYWYVSDYSDEMVSWRLHEQYEPNFSPIKSILMNADLTDLRYLYLFGEYVSDVEIGTAMHMNALSQEAIDCMADTFVDGYLRGFEVMRVPLDKKKYVTVRGSMGFERVLRSAVNKFREHGLEPVFFPASTTLLSRRQVRIGYQGKSPNAQYDFDHCKDKALVYDRQLANRHLEVLKKAFEECKEWTGANAGPACFETFGEAPLEPVMKPAACHYNAKQQKLEAEFSNLQAALTEQYIKSSEISFTIIAFPTPDIGENYTEIFDEIMKVNTLDNDMYREIQQKIIDALDQGEYVYVRGKAPNKTAMKVCLHTLSDSEHETLFENCCADVNIPVGEVFTSPKLTGTEGLLHLPGVFLNDIFFKDLMLRFVDGKVASFNCGNTEDEAANLRLVKDYLLAGRDTLPLGEFAIGTNTTAYAAAEKYNMVDRLPILIVEKMGPHFAIGDTCYSRSEDHKVYNPNGKEIIARENEISARRHEEGFEAYFNCHTDITIPYDEIAEIVVVDKYENMIPIIRDGRFVLDGTEALNIPLNKD